MNKIWEVCQTMLDRHGYFVVCTHSIYELGSIQEQTLDGGVLRKSIPDLLTAKFKVIAEATAEDLDEVYALVGIDDPGWRNHAFNKYRAVAE